MTPDTFSNGRGQAWAVFFGVAAILIGGLVIVSRVVAALDEGPAGSLAVGALPAAYPDTAPTLTPGTDAEATARAATPGVAPDAAMASGGASAPALAEAPAAIQDLAVSPPAAPQPPAPAPAPAPVAVATPARQAPAAPIVSARSVAILDRSCGAMVFGKDETEQLPPASLTKIVTAMVVSERARDLNAPVEDKDISAKNLVKTTDSSVMGIEPGMKFTVRDLLYGLLLPSGNDAALQLAEYVSGGEAPFVALMNNKAAGIGLTGTHFANPHGLDTPGHFSTALDMAKAGRAFLGDPLLARISATPSYETPGAVRIVMTNGNRLLQTYPGAFGVKIGFTTNAKQTIVAAAERNGRQLVLALMGSEDRYTDAAALFDWAFANTPSACR